MDPAEKPILQYATPPPRPSNVAKVLPWITGFVMAVGILAGIALSSVAFYVWLFP